MNTSTLLRRSGLMIATAALAATCLAQQITVNIDGKQATFNDTQPQMINNMVYVPIRGVFEQMGAVIDWDQDQRTVTGRRGSHHLIMRAEGNSAMVDNRSVRLTGRARIIGGSVMVPLRFVSEALGSRVDWNDSTQTVSIYNDDEHFISKGLRPAKKHDGG